MREDRGGQSGLEDEKFGVAEHGGKSVVDVGPHLDHVASESGLGLGGGANFLGFAGAGLGLAAAQNFASDEASDRRPESGFATQLENGPVKVIEIERGIGVNDDGRLAGGGEGLAGGAAAVAVPLSEAAVPLLSIILSAGLASTRPPGV